MAGCITLPIGTGRGSINLIEEVVIVVPGFLLIGGAPFTLIGGAAFTLI